MTGFTGLILAGSRSGIDPVAAYAGVTHKALIPVGGQAMILRVIEALKAAGAVRIVVSTDDAEVIAAVASAGVECLPTRSRPSLSVLSAFEALGAPLVVTTADHALLRPEWITQFLNDAPGDADISILMAERPVIEAAAPHTRRTYYRFAEGRWSGCNLFYLATPNARGALDLWQGVETHRKSPWKVAGMIGPGMLLRYLSGRLTLAEAIHRLGTSVGVRAAMVPSRYGLAAVDVDKPGDLDLVRRLIEA